MFIKIGDIEPIQAIIISGEDVEPQIADELAIVAEESMQEIKSNVVQQKITTDTKDA